MHLVDTAVEDIRAVDVVCGYFSPFFVAEMFWVDADDIPGLAFTDVVHEIAPSLARLSHCLMTVCESRDVEFLKFQNLSRFDIN